MMNNQFKDFSINLNAQHVNGMTPWYWKQRKSNLLIFLLHNVCIQKCFNVIFVLWNSIQDTFWSSLKNRFGMYFNKAMVLLSHRTSYHITINWWKSSWIFYPAFWWNWVWLFDPIAKTFVLGFTSYFTMFFSDTWWHCWRPE